MSEVPPLLRNALGDRYTLDRMIGEGGMARVYLARDLRHGRDVAVKVLRPEIAASLGSDRFLNEIAIAARLVHPHIVPLYDSGEAAGFLFYVMPYVRGASLRAVMRRDRAMELPTVLAIAAQVGDALACAHRDGVLHRDIKPENILLADGHAFVLDFGVAKALDAAGAPSRTRTGVTLGTPGYMSPEQAAGVRDLDARTDVYGLACVVYELLVGETPGLWLTEQAVRLGRFVDAEPTHRARLDALPGRVEQVLARALAMRRTDRYATPGEFVSALEEASHGGGARYSDAEARAIIARAAELQAVTPTVETPAFSVGGIEQIAAEVGIPPEHVREALAAYRRPGVPPHAPVVPAPPLYGRPTRIAVDRTLDGEVPEGRYAALLTCIQQRLGQTGTLALLGRTMVWQSAQGPRQRRNIEVTIAPGGGRTEIRVEEHLADLSERWLLGAAGGVGGSLMGMVWGLMLGGGEGGLVGLLAIVFGVSGAYLASRSAFVQVFDQRRRQLTALADDLSHLAAGEPRLPNPPQETAAPS
jgi:tRNA A-37 threonylcarbamoyl transferase component Bud32